MRAFNLGRNDQGCVLLWSGRVWCWGSAGLGTGWRERRDARGLALEAEAIPGITDAVSIAVAPSFGACALRGDAAVVCWGAALPGAVPSRVDGFCHGGECIEVAYMLPPFWAHESGEDHVTLAPFEVPEAQGATAIALDDPGYPPAPVLRVSLRGGAERCIGSHWGGDGDLAESCRLAQRPERPDLGPPLQCALRDDGTVACHVVYAVDGYAEGAVMSVTGLDRAVSVSSGRWGYCAVLHDHGVACWHMPARGAAAGGVGDRTLATVGATPASRVPGLGDVRQVAVSRDEACVLRANDEVWCWGAPPSGRVPARLPIPPPGSP